MALLRTDHLMLKSVFLSFRDQTYFERAVPFLWLRCRIEYWLVAVKSFLERQSVESGVIPPMQSAVSTVARYTTDTTWQLPSIGQLPFVRQLHRLGSVAWHPGEVGGLLTLMVALLCCLMTAAMFGMQL